MTCLPQDFARPCPIEVYIRGTCSGASRKYQDVLDPAPARDAPSDLAGSIIKKNLHLQGFGGQTAGVTGVGYWGAARGGTRRRTIENIKLGEAVWHADLRVRSLPARYRRTPADARRPAPRSLRRLPHATSRRTKRERFAPTVSSSWSVARTSPPAHPPMQSGRNVARLYAAKRVKISRTVSNSITCRPRRSASCPSPHGSSCGNAACRCRCNRESECGK